MRTPVDPYKMPGSRPKMTDNPMRPAETRVTGRPLRGKDQVGHANSSDQRNRTVDGAGEVKLFISASDVRFSAANNGLKSDIAPCPLFADIVAKVENRATRKILRKLIFGLLCRCVAFQR